MPRIKTWVEIFTGQPYTEEFWDLPDEWEGMSEAQRQTYMHELFEDQRNELANGGFELVEDDD